ncbi:hypothetical protein SCAR479_05321 [Seiridium cardinale]|uniref:Uncharacterized protein n=1 Tax=Seiridium cardinale TaxID=138064 RepID=A0ABR2XWD9_9PEZI
MQNESNQPQVHMQIDTEGRKDAEGARTSIDSSFKAIEAGESANFSRPVSPIDENSPEVGGRVDFDRSVSPINAKSDNKNPHSKYFKKGNLKQKKN